MTEAAHHQAERGGVLLKRRFRTGRRRAQNLLKLGKAAVGTAPVADAERQQTVEVLAEVDALLDRLPVVYRRLFSFRPITDPTMLVGRDSDLVYMRKHVEQWRRGFTNALVLTALPGSGLTSFANVIRESVFGQDDVTFLVLESRIGDEATLASQLAEKLAVPSSVPQSLDSIAAYLNAQESEAELRVVVIEHIDHLFLRDVAGSALLEKALTFFSQTDSRVLWIGTTGDFGWQLAEKTTPAATSLVVRHGLTPLDREGLEELIFNRHRRSGMSLVFAEPAEDRNPILRRRLRKAKKDEERQSILKLDYFDKLARFSGQNIMLALLYWLRSVDVDDAGEIVSVRPIAPLSFAFLSTFDLQRAFTLKSFLDHGTLTVEEHAEAFQIGVAKSMQLFESLGNLLLIERAPQATAHDALPARFQFKAIEPGVRYRIRPVVIFPVVTYLREKNIVH